MQLLLIIQIQLCLSGSAEINFCINFEQYDLTVGVTSTSQIWYNTSTSSWIQDRMVESTKKDFKIYSYLHLYKGVVFHSFGSWMSKKHKEL